MKKLVLVLCLCCIFVLSGCKEAKEEAPVKDEAPVIEKVDTL